MVGAALDAADRLAESGIEASVWDVRVVKPLDPAMIADAAAHPLVVTVEDGIRLGGAGSAIADAITHLEVAGERSAPPVDVLGIPDRFLAHGKPDDILRDLGLDGAGVAEHIRSTLRSA